MIRLLLVLLLASGPVSAGPDWVDDVLGPYVGPVRNDGVLETMETNFSRDAGGRLVGHYHVDDDPPFDGELSGFTEESSETGTFIWTDRYGRGIVRVHFLPEEGRFVGEWGVTVPIAGQIFHGHRFRDPAVS